MFRNPIKLTSKAPIIAAKKPAPIAAPRPMAQPAGLAANPAFRQRAVALPGVTQQQSQQFNLPQPIAAPAPAPAPTSLFHPDMQMNMYTGTNTPPGPVTAPPVQTPNQTTGGYAVSNPPITSVGGIGGPPQMGPAPQLPPDVTMGFGMPPPVQGQSDQSTGMTTQGPGSPQYVGAPQAPQAPQLPQGVGIGFGPAPIDNTGINALQGLGNPTGIGMMQPGPGPQMWGGPADLNQYDVYGNLVPQQ